MKKISKKNCNIYLDKPFTVFEIKDFLPIDRYMKLQKSYPQESYFGKSSIKYNKRTFVNNDEKFAEFLDENLCWKQFIIDLNQQKFINSAFYFSLPSNLKARGLAALKKWTINERTLLTKIFRKVYWSLYFAVQNSDEIIFPHTDARTKFISMIYYQPDNDWDKSTAGTEFWRIKQNKNKWKNWDNIHIQNNLELSEFKKDCEIFHKSKFEPNKLVGFVKNDISWHSVMNLTGNENSLRKTFNLFVRY